MGKNVKVDLKELEDFQKKIGQFQDTYDRFIEGLAKEITSRLLRKVTKRTPVGEYEAGSGKVGGTLKRGWTAAKKNITIRKGIGFYEIEVANPTEYAEYVESGHRTRGKKGWVPGQFFLKLSEEEIQALTPELVQRRMEEKLREMMR